MSKILVVSLVNTLGRRSSLFYYFLDFQESSVECSLTLDLDVRFLAGCSEAVFLRMSMTAADMLAWPCVINCLYTMSKDVISSETFRTYRAFKQTEIVEHAIDKCILHVSVRKRKLLAGNGLAEYQ